MKPIKRVQKKITLLAALAIVFAAGCAKKTVVKEEPVTAPIGTMEPGDSSRAAVNIEAAISTIDVFDDRRRVEEPDRLLHMPDWTIVGQKDAIRPALLDDYRDIVLDETRSHFSPGKKTVSVEIYVLEGRQTYLAGERREKVTAEFKVRIEIADNSSVHDVKTVTGHALLDREELEITYEDVNALYEAAIRESIRNAFAKL